MPLLHRLTDALARTRAALGDRLKALLPGRALDAALLESTEEILLAADLGIATSEALVTELKRAALDGRVGRTPDMTLPGLLREALRRRLGAPPPPLRRAASPPTVWLVAGVNGSGKTTSIAKLARREIAEGRRVMLAASDTFRAAATEQLAIWAERLGSDLVKHSQGADPAAVAFDACSAAKARGVDILIVDTAGRLHTDGNLLGEIQKVQRVIGKALPGAPHETLLVLDATAGQNALAQACSFQAGLQVTGIVLTKLDGTAKGGIVVAVQEALGIPVRFVGVGEGVEDLEPFDPEAFVEALLGTEGAA